MSVYIGFYYGDTSNIYHTLFMLGVVEAKGIPLALQRAERRSGAVLYRALGFQGSTRVPEYGSLVRGDST